jgi:hypothetical protein
LPWGGTYDILGGIGERVILLKGMVKMDTDALLADSVAVAEGKVYVQGGGWNLINVQAFPFVQDRIGIALIVKVPYTATNQEHRFKLSLQDEDGEVVVLGDAPPGVETEDGKIRGIEGAFNIGRPPLLPPGDEQIIPLALNLNGISFERPGRFAFVFEIDGTEVNRLSFRIQQPVQEMRPS